MYFLTLGSQATYVHTPFLSTQILEQHNVIFIPVPFCMAEINVESCQHLGFQSFPYGDIRMTFQHFFFFFPVDPVYFRTVFLAMQ